MGKYPIPAQSFCPIRLAERTSHRNEQYMYQCLSRVETLFFSLFSDTGWGKKQKYIS